MRGCELCPGTARMYCESDEANLCFDCDARVHGANFLVARHSRTLLCRSCQSHTPWKASGPRLATTVSLCESCLSLRSKDPRRGGSAAATIDRAEAVAAAGDHQIDDLESEDEAANEVEEEEEEDDEDEEEEGEEQVVPLTTEETAPLPPPPPAASSSSSSAAESTGTGRLGNVLLKRTRGNVDLPSSSSSEDQFLSASSRYRTAHLIPDRTDDEATSDSFRPLKRSDATVVSGSHRLALGSGCPPI